MNRLNKHLRVILGVTLILNLGLCQPLFADAETNCGDNPPSPTGPCGGDPLACFMDTQQQVFSCLFDAEFNEGDPWAYRILDGGGGYVPITSTGQYGGKIWTDQAFSFECTTFVSAPLDFSVLPPEQQPTPEQLQKMIDENWQVATVAGIVTTNRGQLPIIGMSMAATPAELGQFISYFMVLGILPADDALIVGIELPGPPPNPEPQPMVVRDGLQGMADPQITLDPCAECWDTYNNAVGAAGYAAGCAVDSAEAAHDNAVAAANAAYANAVNAAWNSFTLALAQTLATSLVCIGGCAYAAWVPLIGGAAFVGCLLLCGGNAAVGAGSANGTLNNAVAAAKATRNAAIAAADAALAAARNAAECQFNAAVAAAAAALARCLNAAGCSGG